MRLVASLGVGQAVLPPHERPRMRTLRQLGFRGSDEEVLAAAAAGDGHLLRLCSSAAAMWTANAATCVPSEDSADRRVHLVPANLTSMFHRVLEADTTARLLRTILPREALLARLRELLGESFSAHVATEAELPFASAVAAYPFNSQLLTLPGGAMIILAPEESRVEPRARAFLERVAASGGPVSEVRYLDLRDSMENGGGPACLRQRIVLTDAERAAVRARVFWDETLGNELERWVERHYRDRVTGDDLRDPVLHRESLAAVDELTRILRLGPIYDFQSCSAPA